MSLARGSGTPRKGKGSVAPLRLHNGLGEALLVGGAKRFRQNFLSKEAALDLGGFAGNPTFRGRDRSHTDAGVQSCILIIDGDHSR